MAYKIPLSIIYLLFGEDNKGSEPEQPDVPGDPTWKPDEEELVPNDMLCWKGVGGSLVVDLTETER